MLKEFLKNNTPLLLSLGTSIVLIITVILKVIDTKRAKRNIGVKTLHDLINEYNSSDMKNGDKLMLDDISIYAW